VFKDTQLLRGDDAIARPQPAPCTPEPASGDLDVQDDDLGYVHPVPTHGVRDGPGGPARRMQPHQRLLAGGPLGVQPFRQNGGEVLPQCRMSVCCTLYGSPPDTSRSLFTM